jgi:lipid A ethanolaminephosphotransferase
MNSSLFLFLKPSNWFFSTVRPGDSLRFPSSTIGLIIVIALVNVALYHRPLYSFAVDNLNGYTANSILTLITLAVVVFVVTTLVFSLLVLPTHKLLKPIGVLMFLGNSVALYFVETYQVVIDKSMVGNVFNTNVSEASGFLHPKLLLYVAVFGLLPSVILLKKRFNKTSRLRLSLFAFLIVFAGFGWIYFASSTWLWIDKNAKKLGGMILPWSYVINTIRYQTSLLARSREQILLPPATFTSNRKTVVILVIGESARAQNFSLYGYERLTNPLLAKDGAIPLKGTVSCSTYTTASLNCILSHDGSSSVFSDPYEPLPSYLQRHGVDVIWRSRNWGEPPMKVQTYERDTAIKKRCKDSEGCEGDEVLLSGLSERIQSSKSEKVFVVLHQKGSHGPDYYKKYPQRFELYQPVCQSVELNQCTNDELVNAYDNTIVYTDYLLDRVIELLGKLENVPTLLMYISDHGESLGEHGLYLHGTPYTIAPDVQKEIPFIVWMSPDFVKKEGVSSIEFGQQSAHTQANVFHSVMGAFDVQSEAYDPSLDIFSGSSKAE